MADQTVPQPENAVPGSNPHPAKLPRARPAALLVSKEGEDFPELLKTVRRRVDLGTTGNANARLRQTRTGDLLIEVSGGVDAAELIRKKVSRSLGPETKVRRLENSASIVIRDLDGETSKDEIMEVLSDLNIVGARCVSILKAYGGSQSAVVVLLVTAARPPRGRMPVMNQFLQINLRKSGSARNMMEQTVRELASEILILSEIPRDPSDTSKGVSTTDGTNCVALLPSANFIAISSGRGRGFACMQFPGLLIYSCYFRPGGPVAGCKDGLSNLE